MWVDKQKTHKMPPVVFTVIKIIVIGLIISLLPSRKLQGVGDSIVFVVCQKGILVAFMRNVYSCVWIKDTILKLILVSNNSRAKISANSVQLILRFGVSHKIVPCLKHVL